MDKKPLVIVADDEPHVRETMAYILRRHGFRVQTVADGATALKAGSDPQAAAVLLDVGLPDMSGTEVCRRLRAADRGHDTLLLLVTGRDDLATQEEGLAAGADLVLTKPLDEPRLFGLLARHMAERHAAEG